MALAYACDVSISTHFFFSFFAIKSIVRKITAFYSSLLTGLQVVSA